MPRQPDDPAVPDALTAPEGGTRDRMVVTALELFRRQGYDGTGFRELVAGAGAARGAIYHHFPGGKAEVGEQVAAAGGTFVGERVRRACADLPVREALDVLLDMSRRLLIRDGAPGCPVAAVALAAHDPDGRLRAAADLAFRSWSEPLADALARAGAGPDEAEATAQLCIAAVEGAVILCRARGDESAFDQVARQLRRHVDALTTS